MERDALVRIVESLLFVADEPLTLPQLTRLLEIERGQVEVALAELAEACQSRGIRLQCHNDAYQLVTAPEAAPFIERLLGSGSERRLSGAALEALAIVAYRQPITRAGIEAIRGVNSDRSLRTLQSLGLIAEVGRMETVGRPLLFGTTFEFLQYFGLESLAQLPPIPQEVASSGAELAQQLPLPDDDLKSPVSGAASRRSGGNGKGNGHEGRPAR
ncbi:MAG: SMC-Scp complex subunit ScpB [Bacteroidetes bacterium]|nr:SMC-Scp complex subunit ScpB [Bacteroidota bacterium]MCL5026540.1 SMC-Scp complex subunit ScpB [Chloroflexota bacterium]